MLKKSILILVLSLSSVLAFNGQSLTDRSSKSKSALSAYVPDGFTPESYAKFKKKETDKKKKNLGRLGPKGFQSRSFQSFQESLERGEAKHLMPVMNAKKRVANGELREEDIPYMQRGGRWDNRDIKGAKKNKWLDSDKDYARGGYKKEQSVSIFGNGAGLDWTGARDKKGPAPVAQKLGKNYKPPAVKNSKSGNGANDEPKKKFFGLF